MIDGIRVSDIKVFPDERGFFAEGIRDDWKEFLGEDKIVQCNISKSYPGMIRAWHRHTRGQNDYFIVLKGSLKICVFDEEIGELSEIVLSSDKLQAARIPGKYWHGTKCVSDEPSLTVYFVTNLYDYKNPDEERREWNDQSIIPKTINGKTYDKRVGNPWDWNAPPYK